ncbi:MAG: YheV family putative zinc ribbon protein [Reinekea sp.]|nr:YheV family putative zinc ribbon protein [Reinekea sp.]MDX1472945.1 YheV family putative zinc ribbon protein [Reinekea sp.]
MSKKRFIAGVVCPKCGTLDSIMAAEDTEQQVLLRECVECGFHDRMSTVVNTPKEIQTRVSPDVDSNAKQEAVQVIKILE